MSFTLRELTESDPFIESALATYLLKYRITRADPQPPKRWWGLYEDEAFALAFAYLERGDGGIELTDIYLHPSKRGFRAVEYAGEALRLFLAEGAFPYCMASTFARNKRAIAWAKKFLGIDPVIAGFIFPGAALDAERRAVLEGA